MTHTEADVEPKKVNFRALRILNADFNFYKFL